MRASPPFALAASALALSSGCSLFFDPNAHVGGGGTGDGGPDGGVGIDAGDAATVDSSSDAPAIDAPAEICDPDLARGPFVCFGAPSTTTIGPGTYATRHSVAIAGTPPVAYIGTIEAAAPHVHEIALADFPTVRADTDGATAIADQGVVDTRALAIGAVGDAITFAVLGTGTTTTSTGIVVGDYTLAAFNGVGLLTDDPLPNYGEIAITGGGTSGNGRQYWREEQAGIGIVLATLPYDDPFTVDVWRASRAVEQSPVDVAASGSRGEMMATIGYPDTDGHGAIILWNGQGLSTTVDDVVTPARIDVGENATATSIGLAWVDGTRYILAAVVEANSAANMTVWALDCSGAGALDCRIDDGPIETGAEIGAEVAATGIPGIGAAVLFAQPSPVGALSLWLVEYDGLSLAMGTKTLDNLPEARGVAIDLVEIAGTRHLVATYGVGTSDASSDADEIHVDYLRSCTCP